MTRNVSPCIACTRLCGGDTPRHRVQLVVPGKRALVAYCGECRERVAAAFDRMWAGVQKAESVRPVVELKTWQPGPFADL